MLDHIVLFAFSSASDEDVAACCAALESLEGLHGGHNVWVRPTVTERGQGFTHIYNITLADRAALARYAADPRHVAVVEKIKPFFAKAPLAMDTEYRPPALPAGTVLFGAPHSD